MSSPNMAKRTHGVCQGSLWRHHDKVTSSSYRVYEFCVLVGVRLSTYESLQAFRRGNPPMLAYTIVGASSAMNHNDTSSFRLVSNQGTHVFCTAPTSSCREVWLKALLTGLEKKLLQADTMATATTMRTGTTSTTTTPTKSPSSAATSPLSVGGGSPNNATPPPGTGGYLDRPPLPKVKPPSRYRHQGGKFCHSCGKVERLEFPLVHASTPLPQYGMESRGDLCYKCLTAQGVLDHVEFLRELYASSSQERQALEEAQQLCLKKLVPTTYSTIRNKGSGDSGDSTTNDNFQTPNKRKSNNKDDDPAPPPPRPWQTSDIVLTPNSHFNLDQVIKKNPQFAACQRVSPTLESLVYQYQQGIVGVEEFCEFLDHAVGKRDEAFKDLKKQAIRVAGDMGTAMKLLLEQALPHQVASSSASMASSPSSAAAISPSSVSDDGNTEMLQCLLEFLLDLAIEGELNALAFFWPQLCFIHLRMLPPENAAELARVELVEDFLLTIATRHSIHLAIELIWSHTADLEDANVACGGLLGGPNSSSSTSAITGSSSGAGADVSSGDDATLITPACRKRRFAVLRFLCELESLLFGFEHGWGAGNMCVGSMMTPSPHQTQMLREGMLQVQYYRQENPDQLSRSVRRDKLAKDRYKNEEQQKQKLRRQLQQEQKESGGDPSIDIDDDEDDNHHANHWFSPESMAHEALRIAKNADYVSSHLAFTKRLCDIAEKLRFLPVEQRSMALSAELAKLNASGTMGGDPLNKVRQDDYYNTARVVRIPTTEGHVFRSKERTPVLLLMETLDEAAEDLMRGDIGKRKGKVQKGREMNKTEKKATEQESKEQEPQLTNGDAKQPETKNSEMGRLEKDDSTHKNTRSSPNSSKEANGKYSEKTTDLIESQCEDQGMQQKIDVPSTTHSFVELDDEFHSTHEDEDAVFQDGNVEDAPPDARGIASLELQQLSTRTSSYIDDLDLEGSLSASTHHETIHALRRFDSPIKGESTILTPTPDKNMVELLVTNVVAKHLHLPNLISTEEGNEDAVDEAEKGTDGNEKIKADGGETYGKAEVLSNGGSDNLQELQRRSKKMSALGGFFSGESGSSLAKTGDTRREVLTTIMAKGMRGSNPIAAGAATAVQRQLKELERRRAIELLLTGEEPTFANSEDGAAKGDNVESTRQELLSLGISSGSSDDLAELYNSRQPTDEDEAMEAVRLLLIQYQVAHGHLSLGDAAEVLAPTRRTSPRIQGRSPFGRNKKPDPREMPQVDAGDVDARLVGCGVLPPAVLQALTLWKGSMVTNGELLELVKKDLEYVRHSFHLEDKRDKLSEDSAFWGRFAFGERWAEKAARIAATSPEGSQPGWDLLGVIIKSNDDLRQETFVMQLIELCREAFHEAGLELWLHPYRILSTGRSTGIIEMVRNAMSFDALKKRPGYGKGGLREHLQRMTDYAADPGEAFKSAQRNFVRSLAAYSLLSYLFLFKDRHNGNILLDTAGHVIHIDFGFVLGVAPGGSFSLEMSTPFKLTEEMIEVMDGLRSSLFSEFVTLFCCGFLALQAHCDIFLTIVEITCKGSTFKCFEGRDSAEVVESLRERFCPNLGKEDTIAFALDIIKQATNSYGTAQYDYFQYLSMGIAT